MPCCKNWLLVVMFCSLGSGLFAQVDASKGSSKVSPDQPTTSPTKAKSNPYELEPGEDPDNNLVKPFLHHLVNDQKEFWSTPFRLQKQDAKVLVPFGLFTGGLIAADSWISKQVPDKPSQLQRSLNISDYSTYSMIGISGAAFLLGSMKHDDHLREAGLLSGEAALNATGVTYLGKVITQRPRPMQSDGNGTFFTGGYSFPSEHSAIAWSVASVFAHEYPSTWSQLLAYGLASTVTITRVTAKQHFGSDAFIGSALGWYFGRQVYRAHHDPELGGTSWGDLVEEDTGESPRNPDNMGSAYVPLDSWVYPAMDRLIALGYLDSSVAGMRPWTRMVCARLVQDANARLQAEDNSPSGAAQFLGSLTEFFADEMKRLEGAPNLGANVDTVYSRTTDISGMPLRDGFHLGETIYNDYGRPYAEGFNNVSGVTARGQAGPLYFSFQGEYQYAPATLSYPSNTLQVLASLDAVPSLTNAAPVVSRFRLLDSSFGLTFHNWQISFGKQSLWLGSGTGSAFLFTNNAEPIPMLRFDQVLPTKIPGLSRVLGPMRTEFAIGRLDGANWIFSQNTMHGPIIGNQPFVHIDEVSFQPSSNFEFGMGISVVWGGPGQPITWHTFFRTYTSAGLASNGLPGSTVDPGDRRSTAWFSYRLPHLRDWATLYADSFVEDEISPIGSSRPAIRAGLYLPKLPKIPKMDLRTESVYTDAPNTVFIGNYYHNGRFLSGYTNFGQIMGSWIGRAGKGGSATATYWFSPRTNLQLLYRRQVVSAAWMPSGGGLNDYSVKGEMQLHSGIYLQGLFQYESWHFPVLAPAPKSDITTSIQLTFYPRWQLK
jgi:hypothetical protein